MAIVLSALASLVSGWFAYDLIRSSVAKPRPHTVAYAVGMTMFALATFASFISIAFGWTDLVYKTFYLFGAVLNVPFLALGSVYLVGGQRWGKNLLGLLIPFTFMSALLIVPATMGPIPDEILPKGSEIFETAAITTLVAIGAGIGASILVLAGLISIVRFWRTSKPLMFGNVLIVVGTFVAAAQRTVVDATGSQELFTATIFTAVSLIWAGYRLAAGRRASIIAPGPVLRD